MTFMKTVQADWYKQATKMLAHLQMLFFLQACNILCTGHVSLFLEIFYFNHLKDTIIIMYTCIIVNLK